MLNNRAGPRPLMRGRTDAYASSLPPKSVTSHQSPIERYGGNVSTEFTSNRPEGRSETDRVADAWDMELDDMEARTKGDGSKNKELVRSSNEHSCTAPVIALSLHASEGPTTVNDHLMQSNDNHGERGSNPLQILSPTSSSSLDRTAADANWSRCKTKIRTPSPPPPCLPTRQKTAADGGSLIPRQKVRLKIFLRLRNKRSVNWASSMHPKRRLKRRDESEERRRDERQEQRHGERHEEKQEERHEKRQIVSRAIQLRDDESFEHNKKLYVHQSCTCITLSKEVPRCRHCISRHGGDSCRFVNMRAFPVTIDEQGSVSFAEDAATQFILSPRETDQQVVPIYPTHDELNRPMDDKCKGVLMATSARVLLPILRNAAQHIRLPGALLRPCELRLRVLCDFCNTGIFCSAYLCKVCGQEYCLDCYASMRRLGSQAAIITCATNQLFSCAKQKMSHTHLDMLPTSRYALEELESESEAMERLLEQLVDESSEALSSDHRINCLEDSEDRHNLPSHALSTHSSSELDQETFLNTWRKGEPLLVTDVATRTKWTPQEIKKRHGHETCFIVRCDDDQSDSSAAQAPRETSVNQFFNTFGKPEAYRRRTFGKGSWKLKDWPPTAEFKESCPEIFEDFCLAVPMPDYTRRDGCMNLSSLFPKNAIVPDLGPKMYNAWSASHTKGGTGTTRLHMDMADAVNILLYASDREGECHRRGGAMWNIFRAEDAPQIRDFLREACNAPDTGDPIHSQQYYLDDALLKRLLDEKGIYSWHFIQQPGQAIFIPAGCAHQVCNLSDCIKIAVDFLSPQNVDRCAILTDEFRGLSGEYRKSWKEDALQLRAQLWYAWKACRQIDGRGVPAQKTISGTVASKRKASPSNVQKKCRRKVIISDEEASYEDTTYTASRLRVRGPK